MTHHYALKQGDLTNILTPGTYRINPYAFTITMSSMTDVRENMVGIIPALDGAPLQPGQIAGKQVEGHNNLHQPLGRLN